jgi:beta-glucanase (GH16 family)
VPAVSPHSLGALAVCALLACASSGAVAPPPPPPPPGPPPPPPSWVLVWSDEFTGPAGTPVDTFWNHEIGGSGWGNNEKEYYTSDTANSRLNGNGQLEIVARVAPAGLSCWYGACRYTSARLTTQGRVLPYHGRVEARIKLSAGQGLWPAFWLLGQNIGTVGWPNCGEMDVIEQRGSKPDSMSSAVHGPGYSGNTPYVHIDAPVTTTDYHLYAVEWDGQSIRYFVDSTEHYVLSRTTVEQSGHSWVFDQPFFIILNLAVGGNFDGNPQSDAIFPATMLVDYVRVYNLQ